MAQRNLAKYEFSPEQEEWFRVFRPQFPALSDDEVAQAVLAKRTKKKVEHILPKFSQYMKVMNIREMTPADCLPLVKLNTIWHAYATGKHKSKNKELVLFFDYGNLNWDAVDPSVAGRIVACILYNYMHCDIDGLRNGILFVINAAVAGWNVFSSDFHSQLHSLGKSFPSNSKCQVINVGKASLAMYQVLKPFLPKRITQSTNFDKGVNNLTELIDIDSIPVDYGGRLQYTPRDFQSDIMKGIGWRQQNYVESTKGA